MSFPNALRHTRESPRLAQGRAAIAQAVERLQRALDLDDPGEAAGEVQRLVDQMLEACTAMSMVTLERRLLGLAMALEELDPWAEREVVVRRALDLSERSH